VLLVFGAFALTECAISLDDNLGGGDLRFCLLIVAFLVGPLQPVSTELEFRQSTCAIARSGSAADTQYLVSVVRDLVLQKYLMNDNDCNCINVAYVASLFRRVLLNINDTQTSSLSCGLICAGYDHAEDEGVLYSIQQSGSLMKINNDEGIVTSGSGSTYIQGLIDSVFRGDFELKECVDFVRSAIRLAMSRDGHSGGFVRIYAMDKSGWRDMSGVIYDDDDDMV